MPGITRYAKALLGLAQEQQVADAIGADLARVAQVLADPTLAKILALPTISPKVRKDIVEQLVQNVTPNPLLGNFLRVLAENDRLKDFPAIERSYLDFAPANAHVVLTITVSANSPSNKS